MINSNDKTLVSVCMLSYNDEKYIKKSINDILQQDYENLELLISDDCSSDGSVELIKILSAKDSRIRLFAHTKNLGMQNNYEFVLSKAQGDFIMWASSDDRWDKKYISTLVKAIETDNRLISVAAPFQFIDEEGFPVRNKNADGGLKDYESKFTLLRLLKFSYFYFDDFFYGLHRKSYLNGLKIPVWKGVNKKIAANNNYPVQAFLLARGGYLRLKGDNLFFKRIHLKSKPRHSDAHLNRPFLNITATLIRKINVLTETIKSVYVGSNSIVLAAAAAPFFFIRCLFDIIVISIQVLIRIPARFFQRYNDR